MLREMLMMRKMLARESSIKSQRPSLKGRPKLSFNQNSKLRKPLKTKSYLKSSQMPKFRLKEKSSAKFRESKSPFRPKQRR